jgi:hypothetical protein
LASFAVAHRSEAATSSASICTTLRFGPVLGLPGVALGSARADDSADAGPQGRKSRRSTSAVRFLGSEWA